MLGLLRKWIASARGGLGVFVGNERYEHKVVLWNEELPLLNRLGDG